MSLYIDVRVNDRVVATARVQNVTENDSHVCDYVGDARTEPWGNEGMRRDSVKVINHDRRQSVWSLVEKIARVLQART